MTIKNKPTLPNAAKKDGLFSLLRAAAVLAAETSYRIELSYDYDYEY